MTRRSVVAALCLAGFTATAAAQAPRTAVGVDAKEPRHVVVWQGGRGLYGSSDGGDTWARLGVNPRAVTRIVVAEGGRGVLLGTDEGLLRSGDSGKTFTAADAGPGRPVVVDLASAGPSLFAVAEDGILRSADGGKTFRSAGVPGRAFHLYRIRTNHQLPGQVVLVAPALLFRSDDGGETWTRLPAAGDFEFGSLAWGVGNPPVVLAGNRLGIFRSLDGGATWKGVSGSPAFLRGLWVPDPSTEKYVLVATQPQPGDEAQSAKAPAKGLYRTIDGGKGWSRNLSPDGGVVTEVAFAPGRTEVLYCVTESGGLFRSANRGDSWRAITLPSP